MKDLNKENKELRDVLEMCYRRSQPPEPNDTFEDLARDLRHIQSGVKRVLYKDNG